MTWAEVREILLRGATPARRDTYEHAYRAYVKQATTSLPTPWVPAASRQAQGCLLTTTGTGGKAA
jgi:hypothetical protein